MLQFQALDETKHASNFLPTPKKESETLRVLRKAKGYISKGYTVGMRAVDADGRSTFPWLKDATKWCALGAIDAAYNTEDWHGNDDPAVIALAAQLKDRWYEDEANTVACYNNATSQEAVLVLFDKAIAAEEAKI